MRRRYFLKSATAAVVLAVYPRVALGQATPADDDFNILDFMEVNSGSVEEAYAVSFTNEGVTFADILAGSMVALAGLGVRLESDDDVDEFVIGSYAAFTEWFMTTSDSMSVDDFSEVSVGRASAGDGARAWVWTIQDASEDGPWDEFFIGCTAVWQGSNVQLLWGVSMMGSPTVELLNIAESSIEHWASGAESLTPTLQDVPAGMAEEHSEDITDSFAG